MDQTNVAAPAPLANMGEPIRRTESIAKVTDKLVYAAEALDGVVRVYTHLNAPHRIATPYTQKGGYVSDTNMPLTGPEIYNDGQIIAMVIAETYEVARDASHRIVVRYTAMVPAATMDSPSVEISHPEALTEKDKKAGDFDTAYVEAPVKIEGVYRTGGFAHVHRRHQLNGLGEGSRHVSCGQWVLDA